MQEILAKNPDILLKPTELGNNSLFLVKREFPINEGAESSNSYSLDILMVDRTGTPVLVEVKRSSDTRIRREVVAQMLDYASRASTWSVETLSGFFRANNSEEVQNAYDTAEFWQQVSDNLQSETLRLVFAADRIPDTLRTLIDFLDRNMPGMEVYGVEIRQFIEKDITVLSSAFVGNNSTLAHKAPHGVNWDAESFTQHLLDQGRDEALGVVEDLKRYVVDVGLSCAFVCGTKFPAFAVKYRDTTIFKVMSWAYKKEGFRVSVEIYIPAFLSQLGDTWNEEQVRSVLSQITPVNGYLFVNGPKYLYIDLELLTNERNMTLFKDFIANISATIIEANGPQPAKLPDPQDEL